MPRRRVEWIIDYTEQILDYMERILDYMEHEDHATEFSRIDTQPPRLPPYLPSLGRLLNFAATACNRLCNERLGEHELLLAQWVILSALWRTDGMLVNDLARYTGNNGPAASRIVDRMVRKGLVRRRSDRQDRRQVRVFLSPRARGLEHLIAFFESINAALLEGFTESEAQLLFDMLERVSANARRASRAQATVD